MENKIFTEDFVVLVKGMLWLEFFVFY
jgi:hypothetical protein